MRCPQIIRTSGQAPRSSPAQAQAVPLKPVPLKPVPLKPKVHAIPRGF